MDSGAAADAELVTRVRSGDAHAFEMVFRTHYAELVRFASALLHAPDLAQDIASQVFAELHQRRTVWTIRTSIAAYLIAATRYRVMNHLRTERRERARYVAVHADQDTVDTPLAADVVITGQEDRLARLSAVARALETLSPNGRLIVALRWRRGMSFEEIAEVMGTTSAAVQMQLSRALKALRERAPGFLE